MNRFPKCFAYFLSGIAAMTLVSCAGADASVQRDPNAKVVLNYETSQIIYPLDKYSLTPEEEALISRANEAIIASCTVADGFPANTTVGTVPDESREYGLWNVDRASRNGFSLEGDAEQAALAEQFSAAESTPEWQSSRERCLQVPEIQSRLKAILPAAWAGTTADGAPQSSLVDRLRSEATSLAQADPLWKEVQDKYRACLSSNGLTPVDGWGSQQAQDVMQNSDGSSSAKEREIRIAVQQATCNQDVGVTQKLGDLEASFQAPLITKNEAALAEEYKALKMNVEAARKEVP